jgi:hypothetical protein
MTSAAEVGSTEASQAKQVAGIIERVEELVQQLKPKSYFPTADSKEVDEEDPFEGRIFSEGDAANYGEYSLAGGALRLGSGEKRDKKLAQASRKKLLKSYPTPKGGILKAEEINKRLEAHFTAQAKTVDKRLETIQKKATSVTKPLFAAYTAADKFAAEEEQEKSISEFVKELKGALAASISLALDLANEIKEERISKLVEDAGWHNLKNEAIEMGGKEEIGEKSLFGTSFEGRVTEELERRFQAKMVKQATGSNYRGGYNSFRGQGRGSYSNSNSYGQQQSSRGFGRGTSYHRGRGGGRA